MLTRKGLLLLILFFFANQSAQAENNCQALFKPSRLEGFFDARDLSDPIFKRPRIQHMMGQLYAQMRGRSSGQLVLEPGYGEIGIDLSAGFLVKDSVLSFYIPILLIKANSTFLQPLNFTELKFGDRQNGIAPFLPEFVYAFLGAVELYSKDHPQIYKYIITAAELRNANLKRDLERIGFKLDPEVHDRMLFTLELSSGRK